MKKILLVLSMLLTMIFGYSQSPDTWVQKSDSASVSYSGPRPSARYGAVGFSIGSKGYLGTGLNYSDPSILKDFWEFDPVNDTWSQKADFGGTARYRAAGFSIGNKGYLGTGNDFYSNSDYKDFWEYDPGTNTWTQKADFGGTARASSVGFSIGGNGYIGTGIHDSAYNYYYYKDIWEYNPGTDKWTQKADFGGTTRSDAAGFSIGSKGYIGTGQSGAPNYDVHKDFWEFDPVNDKWTQKADFGGTARSSAVGFSIGNKGYLGTGLFYYKDFWEYDPVTNTWVQKTEFGGDARGAGVGFSIGSKGYLGTGLAGSPNYDPLKDFWEFNPDANAWLQKTGFKNTRVRRGAVGFSIGSKGYLGTGYGYIDEGFNSALKDFWEYDTLINTWEQKADFDGIPRYNAVGFNIGNKGYIGTGLSPDRIDKNLYDFWEYDPASNTWTEKANFPGIGRYSAAGFSIGNKGYLGTGHYSFQDDDINISIDYKDFWEYDPVVNTWTQKANFGGEARSRTVGFSIGKKGYIGTGYEKLTNSLVKDFWEYDPAADIWKQKADFEGAARYEAVGFGINNKGYIGTGYDDSGNVSKDFWEFDPTANKWKQKADFGGTARSEAIGFSIGNKGYLGTGNDNNNYRKDFWEYTPGEDTGCQPPSALKVPFISDTTAVLKWTLPANPVNGFDIVYHVIGSKRVYKRHVTGTTTHIAIGNLQPGTIYRWKIRSDCTADTTKWIDGPDFTTTSLAVSSLNAAAVKGNNISVQIMPNPNKGNFTIQMQLPAKAALTTLSVYNNLGVMIWQQDAGMLSGSVNRNIELKSKLPAGVYVLMIRQGDTSLKKKFVVTE